MEVGSLLGILGAVRSSFSLNHLKLSTSFVVILQGGLIITIRRRERRLGTKYYFKISYAAFLFYNLF